MIDLKRAFARFRRSPAFAGFTLFLFVVILTILVQGPGQFFSVRNINTLFSKNMPLLLTTMATAVLLISGTLDIAIGIQRLRDNVVSTMVAQECGCPRGWDLRVGDGGISGRVVALLVLRLRSCGCPRCWPVSR